MKIEIKNYFKKVTPVFILSGVGIIWCITEILILLLSDDQGELATAVIGIWAFGLYLIYRFDRYLIKELAYKKVIIFELILLLLLPFILLFLTKDIRLTIETTKPYFLVVYSDKGITIENIPNSGIFDKELTLKNDSIIFVNYSLKNHHNFSVFEPKFWWGHKSKYLDTIIHNKKIEIEMRSNNLSNEARDSIFNLILPKVIYLQEKQLR